ncbi:TRAP transporter substrate-binding protein [Desulfopila aestuarii]|uniref:TRAP-type C4-dicarboxylate transport system, substrate-binding protein n=1 Tax=Desulfopila aestuarii DSM 18488 TaxID=1121416 RepID=A0A1M7XYK6_9BACT|nr:TRAP transporter substrate-binding protein [Desulfopila aestuarii]SHO44082.1 TRAP-type C4-dicarboxylate transport system, substrate-binding protein [Desulfopila aestuarii DSM 18488]
MKCVPLNRLFLLALSGAFLLSSTPVFAETIELTFSSPFPVQQVITGKVIKPWIEEIEKASGGEVKIKLFPAGALGKAPEQFDLAEKGIADMSYHLADYTPGRFPLTSVFSLPFMPPTGQKVSEAMWKTFEKEPKYQEEYSKVKVLALFGHAGGHFHTVKTPIRSMADFKGMKMRTANPAISKALTLWGAVPVAQPITETYQSLQLGVLDGSALPYEGIVVFKLNEVTKFTTLADLYTMPMMIVMNKKTWDSLPKNVQELIDNTTGLKMSAAAGKAFDDAEKPFREISMKKGIEEIALDPSELAKMQDITMPLRDEWAMEMEEKGLPGKEVLKTALSYTNE